MARRSWKQFRSTRRSWKQFRSNLKKRKKKDRKIVETLVNSVPVLGASPHKTFGAL
jgi:hypothetical protein